MSYSESWLNVGELVAPQGLKGEIRINPSSDFPERFTKPGKRWLKDKDHDPKEIFLKSGRQLPGKSIYVVRFKGIDSRNQAQELIGQKLLVHSSDRPKLPEGEFHLLDLVGLEAKLGKTELAIGKVTDLQKGGNDLLEITLLSGRKVLVPFVKEIVPDVHLKEGWIRMTPPAGLLDL